MDNKVVEIIASMANFRQIPLSVKLNDPIGKKERTIMGLVKWCSDKVMLMRDNSNQEHRIDYFSVGKIDVMRY